MPSIQPTHFGQNFFQPDNSPTVLPWPCEPSATRAAAASSEEKIDRIHYCADKHESHANFCASEDFKRYRKQVENNVQFLSEFCSRHKMPDARQISDDFKLFFSRRFDHVHYYSTRAELIDSAGKKSWDNFCDVIRNEVVPLETRIAAIRNLSQGLTMCADGAVANLVMAERDLVLAIGGFREKLLKIKEETIRAVLQEALVEEFKNLANYSVNEIHYGDAAWNSIALEFGLAEIPDGLSFKLSDSLLKSLRNKVRQTLTPDKIALVLAEECLEKIKSSVPDSLDKSVARLDTNTISKLSEKLDDLCAELGLESGALRLRSFLKFDGDGATWQATPMLIAVDLLHAMHTQGVLLDTPQALAEWGEEGGIRAGLYAYGDGIGWIARTTSASMELAWSAGMETEALTLHSLLQWANARGSDSGIPPGRIASSAWRAMSVAALSDVPPKWLTDASAVHELFRHMPLDQADRYLRDHYAHFVGFPIDERSELIDHIIGIGPAARRVVAEWYPDPLALISEWSVSGQGVMTRLERWMAENNARAIDALGVFQHSQWRYIPYTSREAWYGALGYGGGHAMLCQAIEKGNTEAIAAWHRLLRNLAERNLTDPDELLALNINSAMGTALLSALKQSSAAAIQAVHAILADPRIATGKLSELFSVPHYVITDASPGDFVYFYPTERLWDALREADEASIVAFRSMLTDWAVLPHTAGPLREMLIDSGDGSDEGHLTAALGKGDISLLQALHCLLDDAAMNREQALAMPEILQMRWRGASPPGLWHVFKSRHCLQVVDKVRDLLADPAINIHIRHALPAMLGPKPAGENDSLQNSPEDNALETILKHAMRHRGADGVLACRQLLRDPVVLPYIKHALPELLAGTGLIFPVARGVLAASLDADRLLISDTILALHLMLVDPELSPHINDDLPRILAVDTWSGDLLLLPLERGDVLCIQAVHGLLTDNTIGPRIRPDLGKFLTAELLTDLVEKMRMPSTPMGAARALSEFLDDPAILPFIEESLPAGWKTAIADRRNAIVPVVSRAAANSNQAAANSNLHSPAPLEDSGRDPNNHDNLGGDLTPRRKRGIFRFFPFGQST